MAHIWPVNFPAGASHVTIVFHTFGYNEEEYKEYCKLRHMFTNDVAYVFFPHLTLDEVDKLTSKIDDPDALDFLTQYYCRMRKFLCCMSKIYGDNVPFVFRWTAWNNGKGRGEVGT